MTPTAQARVRQTRVSGSQKLCSSSPPEFVPSKQVSLPVLPKVEDSVDLLQVSGEFKAGEHLGIAFLQLICFVDPHLVAWEKSKSRAMGKITLKTCVLLIQGNYFNTELSDRGTSPYSYKSINQIYYVICVRSSLTIRGYLRIGKPAMLLMSSKLTNVWCKFNQYSGRLSY